MLCHDASPGVSQNMSQLSGTSPIVGFVSLFAITRWLVESCLHRCASKFQDNVRFTLEGRHDMSLDALEDLLMEELNDLYDCEKKLTKALPKMAKAASSEELSEAFSEHLKETEKHVTRLERVFSSLGRKPGRKTCEAINGLLEEGKELMEEKGEEPVKDAALIAAAQKVEHYEIASYGCVRTWAQCMGKADVAEILQETLDEEGAADKKLTEIAESLNMEAEALNDEEKATDDDVEEEDGDMGETPHSSRRSHARRTRTSR
jgi:ferritin-like metal-binding protein YciE